MEDLLKKFGKIEIVSQSENGFEFKITEGFKNKLDNTLECINVCRGIAENYPHVKYLNSRENKFHLILKK